ncbi:MAG TPA: DinB family protein [Candidatus Angelobacter sp.]|nr:DinB family protein [Candidatus Angelobacter sp.]
MNLYGSKQLANSVRTVRQNTIVIAEDIPEEQYDYRPTPQSRSVRETFLHILAGAQAAQRIHGEQRIASFENLDFRAVMDGLPVKEKDQRSKTEIVALLRSEGDRWCQWIEQIPESVLAEPVIMSPGPDAATKNRLELLLGTKEHEMHHRAQLMVIERLLGIVPHLTRKRQPVRETAVR